MLIYFVSLAYFRMEKPLFCKILNSMWGGGGDFGFVSSLCAHLQKSRSVVQIFP